MFDRLGWDGLRYTHDFHMVDWGLFPVNKIENRNASLPWHHTVFTDIWKRKLPSHCYMCVNCCWEFKKQSSQWCKTPVFFFSCSNIDDRSLFWLQQRPFNCISRGGREGRVPCHVPPSDISKGPGSRLQSGGDDAGPKRQKPLHSAGLFDSQQASPQGNCGVWSCWREAGGA